MSKQAEIEAEIHAEREVDISKYRNCSNKHLKAFSSLLVHSHLAVVMGIEISGEISDGGQIFYSNIHRNLRLVYSLTPSMKEHLLWHRAALLETRQTVTTKYSQPSVKSWTYEAEHYITSGRRRVKRLQPLANYGWHFGFKKH